VMLLTLNLAGNVLPLLPPLEILKDRGMALYAGLLLWLGACVAMRRVTPPTEREVPSLPARPVAA
jgi:hypothetical protein